MLWHIQSTAHGRHEQSRPAVPETTPAPTTHTHKRAGHTACQHILQQRPQVVHALLTDHAEPVTSREGGVVRRQRAGMGSRLWHDGGAQGASAWALVMPARQAAQTLQTARSAICIVTHAGQSVPSLRKDALNGSCTKSFLSAGCTAAWEVGCQMLCQMIVP